jgi:hypothetical protein
MSMDRVRAQAGAAFFAVLIAAITVVVALASVAAAGPSAAKKQRVAIMTGAGKTTLVSAFALIPLQGGPLKADSGKMIAKSHESNQPVTLKGRQGTLIVSGTQQWTDTGRGFSVVTSTWKVLRGTGQYAGATGGGTGVGVWHAATDDWSTRDEGVLTLP